MRTSFPRIAIATAAALTAALSLASCSGAPAATGSNQAPATFTVGVFGPDVTFTAFYSAIGEGGALAKKLKDQNIELKIETIPSGSTLVAALAGGSVDAAIVPGSAVIGVSAKGGQIVPLMNMFDGPSQQIIARSELKESNGTDLATFADKRWAFTRAGSISEISAKIAAESAGLKWSDVQRLPLGSGSETQAVLESGRADILSTSPANAAKAVGSNKAYLVTNPQDNESSPIGHQLNAVFAGSPKFVTAHPQLTQDVVTALVGGLHGLTGETSAQSTLGSASPEFKSAVSESWDKQWEYSVSGFSRATGGFSDDELKQTVTGAQMVSMVDASYAVPGGLFDNSRVITAYKDLQLPLPEGL